MHTHRHPRTHGRFAGLLVIAALAAVAGACSGGAGGAPSPTVAPEPTPISSPTPPVTPGDQVKVPQGILDQVLADAATRTGVPAADITVVTAKGETWPNGALGCPQPGMMYTEMIEPGYQVVVEAAGQRLDYRVGSQGIPALCENPPAAG